VDANGPQIPAPALRAQEIARTEALAREEARAALWTGLTLRRRLAIAGALLVTLLIGVLIGAYGLRGAGIRNDTEVTPPVRWSSEAGLGGETAAFDGVAVTPTAWPLRIYVSGAVVAPGVVTVSPGSLVVDALEAAGGATSDADLDVLNLASPVSDNQHVLVPTLRVVGTPRDGEYDGESVPDGMTMDINTATADDLERLPDIGSTRAAAIVAFREAHGPFQHVEDILLVPGIGPAIFERIAPLITVGP